jgi:hypothetical protein
MGWTNNRIEEALVARRRVRGETIWCQPLLPGLAAQLAAPRAAGAAGGGRGGALPGSPVGGEEGAGWDWEAACFREACRYACRLAERELAAAEARLHAARPDGYAVEGWRARTLVTRFGDVRVRRRLYRAPDGAAHLLLDEHLGWPAGQAATPALAALLVDWATGMPFRTAARRLAEATAGVVSGSTAWRLLQQVAARATAAEAAAHAACARTAALPAPVGERVVPALYLEADGVWVKTQREPAHPTGYELKCASAYEGWEQIGRATPGHPRARYRLREKQVYCHGHARADAAAPEPFWEAVSLALARTYDLSRIPVVVVGGDGANWIDTALEGLPQAVRQRDGFHLARDAARGWGPEAGALLYQAVRTGDQATALEVLALPPPTRATPPVALLPPPVDGPAAAPAAPPAEPAAGSGSGAAPLLAPPEPAAGARRPRRPWSARQVQRARAAVTGQVGTADAAVDWRLQVPPELVPPDARGLGTQEGTNAHLLAKRMKRKGMAWSAPGARHLAKARELVTNGGPAALARWCRRPPAAAAPAARAPGGFAPAGPLPWPQVACPAAHGPRADPTAARLHHLTTGGRARHRLT